MLKIKHKRTRPYTPKTNGKTPISRLSVNNLSRHDSQDERHTMSNRYISGRKLP